MFCMRIRFTEKGHRGFQPERKWEIPREEHHVQQKAYEFSHGHFEISMWWYPGSNWKKNSDDLERGQHWTVIDI